MKMWLLMLLLVLLSACDRGDPILRIKESCEREFGAQGASAVDKCVRWAVAPPSGAPEKGQPR
jgi:hypothetical protein